MSQSNLEQGSLGQLGSLEELHGFSTADSSIFVLVSHPKPVVKQIYICHVSSCQDLRRTDDEAVQHRSGSEQARQFRS